MILTKIINLILGYFELHVCRDKMEHFKNVKKLETAEIKYKTHVRGSSRSVYEEKIYDKSESITYIIDVKKEDYNEALRIIGTGHEAV